MEKPLDIYKKKKTVTAAMRKPGKDKRKLTETDGIKEKGLHCDTFKNED